MKVACLNCGIHFVQDFEKTFKVPCNYWGEIGLSTLPVENKRELWEWMFQLPSDKIFIETGMAIGFKLIGGPVADESDFVTLIPGYADWNEAERQEFQRRYFKAKSEGKTLPRTKPILQEEKEEEQSN